MATWQMLFSIGAPSIAIDHGLRSRVGVGGPINNRAFRTPLEAGPRAVHGFNAELAAGTAT